MAEKKLVRHFINECIKDQEWAKRYKENYIEFDNYFKTSNSIEPDTEEYKNLMIETENLKLSAKEYLIAARYKSRATYFKTYWQKRKQEKLFKITLKNKKHGNTNKSTTKIKKVCKK